MKAFRSILLFVVCAFTILFFAQCEKEANHVGTGLLSPKDLLGLGYTDTIAVGAFTMPVDTVTTSGLSYAVIGSLFDPIFGRTDATCYTQLLGDPSHQDWGVNPKADSCILVLPYMGGMLGDSLSPMTLRVYQLIEDIQGITDKLYTSKSTVAYDQAHILGELTFIPHPKDSVMVNNKKAFPQVRIPLSNYFIQRIFAMPDSVVTSQTEFQKNFKGFCIVAEPQTTSGKGSIVYFALPADKSKLAQVLLHYHNDDKPILTTTFSIGGTSSFNANRFYNYNHHNYADATQSLRNQLAGNTADGKQSLYLQGLAGTRVKLLFPNLHKWSNKQLMINDVQLILTNAESFSNQYPVPPLLLLRVLDSSNMHISRLADDAFINGSYDKKSNSYRFRIPRHLQQVIIGKQKNYGLFMSISSEAAIASRVVLNGKEAASNNLKLLVKYSYKQ